MPSSLVPSFLVTCSLLLATCTTIPSPECLYVSETGSDTDSGLKTKPLATVNAALSKGNGPVEIVILGELNRPLTIENPHTAPVILRGDPSLPGTLKGTLTIGPGADVTLGENLTVTTGGERGVEVLGGSFTLDGGIIAGNTAPLSGAGVYVESGAFTMKAGAIRANRTGSTGGGVYVKAGTFTVSGGVIEANKTGGRLSGRAGGGVYISSFDGGAFKKSGGLTISNTAPSFLVTPSSLLVTSPLLLEHRGGQENRDN